jgi:hypothetical protein
MARGEPGTATTRLRWGSGAAVWCVPPWRASKARGSGDRFVAHDPQLPSGGHAPQRRGPGGKPQRGKPEPVCVGAEATSCYSVRRARTPAREHHRFPRSTLFSKAKNSKNLYRATKTLDTKIVEETTIYNFHKS